MKITGHQLKKIIKEEKIKLLGEQYIPEVGDLAMIISTGEEVEVTEIHQTSGDVEIIRAEFTDNPGETALFRANQLESADTYGRFG